MTKQAKNEKIIAIASKVTQALEKETEEILRDTEEAIKSYFPAKYVKAALKETEKVFDDNGMEVAFDKTVTREMRKKTASLEATGSEMREAIQKIASCAIDEMEDVLADANEVVNTAITRFASKERPEVEAKLKNIIEGRLHHCGIFCKFDRVIYDPQAAIKKALAAAQAKKTVSAKKESNRILAAMKKASK